MARLSGRQWAMISLLAGLWGCSYLFNSLALQSFRPASIAFLRVFLAALILWLLCLSQRQIPPLRLIPHYALMGLINNALPFGLIVWGQQFVSGAVSAMIIALAPLFSLLIGALWLGVERLNSHKILGLLLGIAGIGLLSAGGQGAAEVDFLLGLGALAAAALCYALGSTFSRSIKGVAPLPLSAASLGWAALLLAPFVISELQATGWSQLPAAVLMAIAGLVLLGTVLAYLLYFRLLQEVGATNVLLVTIMAPLVAVLLDWLVLGEVISLRVALGMLLILSGLLTVDGRFLPLFLQPKHRV